ncbi:MAG: UDP-glucose 4-epimerase GalE, partial [Verrucomicrobiota bacterium]|nr:UDP-glucose 4-epimerase GalE [Verrucomicrobiota bacterium]MEC7235194.1 UDP-glucose 4-epimerase GalE [Verrucomicrobiota bacterium]
EIPFYDTDLGNQKIVGQILREESIELVMHFAAFAYVGESVTEPRKYYNNNFVATLRLLETMLDKGVKKFVFSSTCATYGEPQSLPIVETLPQAPINPYGQTKLDVENCLKSFAHAYGLSFAAFRYFNAAGAAEDGTIGEDHQPETHLIPLVLDAATGRRDHIKIFGTDYDTPDGTCLRDYVHVDDLSRAHIAAFEKLETPGASHFYNLGTGRPNSVREIIDAVEAVTGLKVPVIEDGRRAGDPPALYADSSKAQDELGWEIKFTEVKDIIETAWRWHQAMPEGFSD